MKTITIRPSGVEAAMLVEVQKVNKEYRDLGVVLIGFIRRKYSFRS